MAVKPREDQVARRPHGTGSVYPRADGRWAATIEAGWTARGTRRRITVTGKTKSEAQAKLREKQRKIAAEGLPAAGVGRATVKSWAEAWLDGRQAKVRPKTWNADRSLVANWIVPTIGHRRLDLLAPSDVHAVHRAMETKGLALSTMNRTHAVLLKMLRDAIVEGHQVPQRILLIEGPGVGTNDRNALPLEDALAILEVATTRPDASRWAAALLQGMRPAETLGLTRDMVDLEARELTLAWQLLPLPYKVKYDRTSGFRVPRGYEARQVDGALHLVRPKSKAGWRVIPLVPWMAASLEAWFEIAPANRHGIVWPQEDGHPRRDDDDRAAWHAITDAAQVAVTEPAPTDDGPEVHGRRPDLYEARHTTATLLKAAGVDDQTITAIMGHASILSTNAYLHTDRTRARAALEGMAQRLRLIEG
jgi:integrase